MAKCEHCGRDTFCSTADFIKDLSLGQLTYLLKIAKRKVDDIENQEKIQLLRISSGSQDLAFFKADDRDKATDFLSNYIKNSEPKVNSKLLYEISSLFVYESDIDNYLNFHKD